MKIKRMKIDNSVKHSAAFNKKLNAEQKKYTEKGSAYKKIDKESLIEKEEFHGSNNTLKNGKPKIKSKNVATGKRKKVVNKKQVKKSNDNFTTKNIATKNKINTVKKKACVVEEVDCEMSLINIGYKGQEEEAKIDVVDESVQNLINSILNQIPEQSENLTLPDMVGSEDVQMPVISGEDKVVEEKEKETEYDINRFRSSNIIDTELDYDNAKESNLDIILENSNATVRDYIETEDRIEVENRKEAENNRAAEDRREVEDRSETKKAIEVEDRSEVKNAIEVEDKKLVEDSREFENPLEVKADNRIEERKVINKIGTKDKIGIVDRKDSGNRIKAEIRIEIADSKTNKGVEEKEKVTGNIRMKKILINKKEGFNKEIRNEKVKSNIKAAPSDKEDTKNKKAKNTNNILQEKKYFFKKENARNVLHTGVSYMENKFGFIGLLSVLGLFGIFTNNRACLGFFGFLYFIRYIFTTPDENFRTSLRKAAAPAFFINLAFSVLTIILWLLIKAAVLLPFGLSISMALSVIAFAVILAFYNNKNESGNQE